MEHPEPEDKQRDEVIAPAVVDLLKLPNMPKENFSTDVKKNLRRVRDLIKTNKLAGSCAQALLDAYQLQQWAVYTLNQLGIEPRSAGVLIEYVKLHALTPFQEEAMRNSLRDRTLPYVADRILEHLKNKIEDKKKEKLSDEH